MKLVMAALCVVACTGCAFRSSNGESLAMESDEPRFRLVDPTSVADLVKRPKRPAPTRLGINYALHVENSHWERDFLIFEADAFRERGYGGGSICDTTLN